MPLALAFVASALIHVAALVSPGWTLPGTHDNDSVPAIDAVLAKPAPRAEAPAAARPAPKPRADRPRPPPAVAASASSAAVAAAPGAPAAEEPAPAAEEPAPVAAPPAPTVREVDARAAAAAPEPPPARIALPGKGRLRYVITRGEGGFVVGQAVHDWEHDGRSYRVQSVTETTGLAALFKPARVVQSSRGEVTAAGLKPAEFRHERVGGLDTASFDWARGVVAYAGREDGVGGGAQDMLSMYYQLVLLAPANGALDLPIATGRKLETYRFEVVGEEAVTLGAGQRRAVHLKTRSGSDSIELWLEVGADAARRGLPLKIRFTDRKGEIFDQLAQDIDIEEPQ